MAITPNKRKQAEKLIYDVFDAVDKTGTNTEHYKQLFAEMSDEQFYKFAQRRLPYRMTQELFKIEPTMSDIFEAFKVLDKPLIEKLKLPYLYKNTDGVPIESKECLVLYIHLKRMKQMLSKKTNTAMEIANRDMKTGLLVSDDKGGKESDREFETLAIMNLDYTMDEFIGPKADAMRAKSEMYNTISSKGFVSEKDIRLDKDDSLARNMMNVYLLGCNIHSNLIDEDYMTPLTLKNKQQRK